MDSTGAERLLNVVDVEATCWAGGQPPGAVSEIIEIGLTVVDLATAERLARHRILVRPVRSTVSEFCTDLTGLTQDEVDGGVGFAEACRLLAVEHHAGSRPWASWGDYDRNQFTGLPPRRPWPSGQGGIGLPAWQGELRRFAARRTAVRWGADVVLRWPVWVY
ncbi:hypothetical protein P3T36_005492 [Kitasatospora sp. MAP12-15]|uniref:3'-5' exonuclease n=1 Tax=unclassified Kitasatospora TaxID=2633591 RepID=UPI0024762437|nr:3'-5' exonuclease [Kitasatospora sp. MAP12-44]MDH6108590.1 hypothetical protein [Kitasatospora sp. MAP12-44]